MRAPDDQFLTLVLTTLLLCAAPGAARLHAAPVAASGEAYNTEGCLFHSRPDPTRETFLGCIGTTGLRARIYPGVSLKVEEMMPDSPAEGNFAEGEILTGINGVGHVGFIRETKQQIIAIFQMPNQ